MADTLLPVADARRRILASLSTTRSEEVALTAALGRVTAEAIAAQRTQPPQAVSAMDGYAVRAADLATLPATLTRIASAPAGHAFAGAVGAGEAVRIFTGAALPDGADTIVIQEDVDAEAETDGTRITVRESAAGTRGAANTKGGAVAKGRYIRPAGLDFRAGDVGIAAGRVLTARDIGLAAAMNAPWLKVRRRPRIAILASGDEIVRPGDPIAPGQITSSNSYALAALTRCLGGAPIILGIAPDTVAGIQQMVAGAEGADFLVTTGGASVGEHDLIQQALGRDAFGPGGLDVDFWRIAMRPGKPLIFGHIAGVPMLGLPGNPVSTLVCGLVFLGPAIKTMLGLAEVDPPAMRARLGSDLARNDERQDYLRATLSRDGAAGEAGEAVATPFPQQDSSMLARLAAADCLIVRPPNDAARVAGEAVQIILLTDSLSGPAV